MMNQDYYMHSIAIAFQMYTHFSPWHKLGDLSLLLKATSEVAIM